MADPKIQRGEADLGNGTTVTITAGTDYDAPASLDNAFIRITNPMRCAHVEGDAASDLRTFTVEMDDPENLLTSITFRRGLGDGTSSPIPWEILEYTGPAGGANEFVVHSAEIITLANTEAVGSSTVISGVTDDADVVVFITCQERNTTGDNIASVLHTAEWDSVNNVAKVTRGDASGEVHVGIAVVEFTGSNWSVQRATHAYTAAGTIETETITSVDTSKVFTHSQLRMTAANLDEAGQEAWVSGAAELSFQLQSGADVSGHTAVVWVVENTQSGGTTDANVQRYNGATDGSSVPDIETETITAVTMAEASIMGETARSTGTGSAVHRASIHHRLTSATEVTIQMPDDGQTGTYRGEVYTWPTAAAGGGTTVSLAGTLSAVSVVDGAVARTAGSSGTVASASTFDGVLRRTVSQAGSLDATSGVTGALARTRGLAGQVDGLSTLDGGLARTAGMAGSVDALSAMDGSLARTAGISGQMDAASSLSALLEALRTFGGSVDAASALSGDLTVSAAIRLAGTLAAVSALDAGLSVDRSLSGDLAAASVLSGPLGVTRGLSGDLAAASTLSGPIAVVRVMGGTVVVVSTLDGALVISGQGFDPVPDVEASLAIVRTLGGEVFIVRTVEESRDINRTIADSQELT